MEKFADILLKDIGIIVQFINGILDLPKREGETTYDWGDEIEPLVSAEDIYFGTRQIVVDAFFDNRKGSFLETSETLRAITGNQTFETEYGNYQVRLDRIEVKKSYKTGKSLQIIFVELNPDLSGPLPTASPAKSKVKIDGYDLLANFGLLVESAELSEISKLKASSQTVFQTNYLSVYREPQELEVKVNGIYASKAEMTIKINALNRLLAKEGIRFFEYHDRGFQAYMTEGYKVDIKRKLVTLTLKLNVMVDYNIDAIVQRVIDEVNIQVNPQSDLSITDSQDPSYIKGRDTFKAADSAKLNGQSASYYAKDSELEAVRTTDYADRLENATDI
tara:strand:- start:7436 stop:8437 length:1002 start_codon:yes stop_codon:yes gene_type:complete